MWIVTPSNMKHRFLSLFLTFFLLIHGSLQANETEKAERLSDGSVTKIPLMDLHSGKAYVKRITIEPTSHLTFNVTDIPMDIAFIIFQIHTYQYNITLSYDEANLNKVSNKSVFGSNVGLFIKAQPTVPIQMYLKSDNAHSVDAAVVITGYNNKAPVPGGCNMEFNTEVAPYQKLDARETVLIVDMQPASLLSSKDSKFRCEKNPISHEVYQIFLYEQDFEPETYFSGIESMLTVEDIVRNGRKIPASRASSPMRRVYSAYTGVGSVFVAVSTYENYSSAYVPSFSYACSPILYPESCQILNNTLAKVFCVCMFLLGILSIQMGHECKTLNNLLPIFVIGCIIGYAAASSTNYYFLESTLLFGFLGGLVTVILSAISCSSFGLNTLGLLMFNLAPGMFFASVAYMHAPDALISSNDAIFWTTFATFAVTISMLMCCLNIIGTCITTTIFSSYLIILLIDYCQESSLKYIIINIVRRATVPEFNVAIVEPPIGARDIFLIVLWCIIAAYGVMKPCMPGVCCKGVPCGAAVNDERTPLINTRFIGHVSVHDSEPSIFARTIHRIIIRS